MKIFQYRNVRSGYFLAFILVIVCYSLIFFTNKKLETQADQITHTYEVINTLEGLMSYIKDAETGMRGYFVVQNPVFLEPYLNSTKKIDSAYGKLTILTVNSRIQQKRLDTLNTLIQRRLNFFKTGLNMFNANDHILSDTLTKMSYIGKTTMDRIRSLIAIMQQEERNTLKANTDTLNNFRSTVYLVNIISLIVAFLLIIYSILIFTREHRQKEMANKKVWEYQHQLEKTITDLQTTNTELIELKRMEKFAATGRIARIIAHEVKNPLTNISLAAEQIKEQLPPEDDTLMLFQMISRNANRINQLVSDLLASTKVSELAFENLQINPVVDETLELAKDRIELNNITVKKNYSAKLPSVSVDKAQIKIALINLIVNAIEAMQPGKGILTITTENKKGKCLITVQDNGSGMKEEDMAKLFEPYFTKKPKGTGLGLTHTQNIIISHHGSVEVESKPGTGTKFMVTLNFA